MLSHEGTLAEPSRRPHVVNAKVWTGDDKRPSARRSARHFRGQDPRRGSTAEVRKLAASDTANLAWFLAAETW